MTSKPLLVGKTGETLSTQEDEAPAFRRGRARDRAVLFVHGFLDGASVWNDVVARLEGRNVELIQVDLAGMGERSSEDGPYTLERFAADVASAVLRIGKPVVLVGQSMGAQVAELVAASLPQQVAALVLLTPIPLAGTGLSDAEMTPFTSLGDQPAAQRDLRRQLSVSLDEKNLERLGSMGDRVKPAVVAASANAWNRGHPAGRHPSKYPGPVLIVRGEEDPFVTSDMVSTAIVPRFCNPTTATIHAAGHWPHVEQSEAFATSLAAFLDSLDVSTAQGVKPQSWTHAFDTTSADAFGAAFAPDIVLEASALLRPVEGRDRVKAVMAAASRIYEALAFTHEAVNGSRHYLEWQATAFGGQQFAGVTVLTKDGEGRIIHAAIHHRPLNAALQFSSELGRRLRGDVDASHFYPAATAAGDKE